MQPYLIPAGTPAQVAKCIPSGVAGNLVWKPIVTTRPHRLMGSRTAYVFPSSDTIVFFHGNRMLRVLRDAITPKQGVPPDYTL